MSGRLVWAVLALAFLAWLGLSTTAQGICDGTALLIQDGLWGISGDTVQSLVPKANGGTWYICASWKSVSIGTKGTIDGAG